MHLPHPHRSILFLSPLDPGHAAAVRDRADLVCLDLEASVPDEAKDQARDALLAALADSGPAPAVVRVNTLRRPAGLRDILAVLAAPRPPAALLLPEVASPEEVVQVRALAAHAVQPVAVCANIETALGLERAPEIARAGAAALFFGGFGMAQALGVAPEWAPLLYARSRVVHAAAVGGIPVLDSPQAGENAAALSCEATAARALGFTGKAAKRVADLPIINAAFGGAGVSVPEQHGNGQREAGRDERRSLIS